MRDLLVTLIGTPFVFGHPRSGTSLLTAILDRHSKITMLPETHLLNALASEAATQDHERLMVLAWDRLQTRMADLHLLPSAVLDEFRRHPSTPEGLLCALMRLWALRAGKPIAGEKTPAHLRFAGRILDGIPDAGAVLLVRDGRAVIEAMTRTKLHADTPLDELVDRWISAAERCDKWLHLYPTRSRLVRFEDLVREPERVLRSLLAWLGVNWEPGVLVPGPTTTYRKWEHEVKRDVGGPIDAGKAGRWAEGERLLSPEDLGRLAPWLVRFGYPPPSRVAPTAPRPRRPLSPRTTTCAPTSAVFLVGAHRAGIASLTSWLEQHIHIVPAAARSRPVLAIDWRDSPDQPPEHFRPAADREHPDARVVSHAASYYLAHPDVARRARQAWPGARIVIVLRNPTTRAYSHWLHSWRTGAETLPFDRAVAAESERLAGQDQRLATDPSAVSFAHIHYSYALQGRYADHVARWRSEFPEKQVLVLVFEELLAEPEVAWEALCQHLGVTRSTPGELPRLGALRWPLLPEEVRDSIGGRAIQLALAESTRRLEAMLGRALPWWG